MWVVDLCANGGSNSRTLHGKALNVDKYFSLLIALFWKLFCLQSLWDVNSTEADKMQNTVEGAIWGMLKSCKVYVLG